MVEEIKHQNYIFDLSISADRAGHKISIKDNDFSEFQKALTQQKQIHKLNLDFKNSSVSNTQLSLLMEKLINQENDQIYSLGLDFSDNLQFDD